MPLQATSGAASYDAFGGGVAAVPNYIEDVFSTYLYTGIGGGGSAISVPNGIDLTGKGGLVWIKQRNAVVDHYIYDTARGNNNFISSNTTFAQTTFNAIDFGSSGFTDLFGWSSSQTVASWTFRKQPKFFDVVTYTGTGANRTIAHNLKSVPGCIMVKRTDTTSQWQVYHRSIANTDYLELNTTAGSTLGANRWNSTTATSTVFSIGTAANVNASGGTYVAYIFAHDAGGFGLTGTDNVISCGSFTTDGSGNATVDLGYEPQWIMNKAANNPQNWIVTDNMRGMFASAQPQCLFPNTSGAEVTATNLRITSTGFTITGYAASQTSIYIAIRRGPMKVPTSGTSVFSPVATSAAAGTAITTGFPVDLILNGLRNSNDSSNWGFYDRLRGISSTTGNSVGSISSSTAVETSHAIVQNAKNTGFEVGAYDASSAQILHSFARAPSFFDEVCYTGTGSATTVAHSLGVAPELMIVKRRDAVQNWFVYSNTLGNNANLNLNTTNAVNTPTTLWNTTTPTSSVFSIGSGISASGGTYVSYLFATCAGVSKVFSYTGNGSSQTINCGFAGGARFVLIKSTNNAGAWYVFDTARGMVYGTDPYLQLENTGAEVATTNACLSATTGFTVNDGTGAAVNNSGWTFIGLAIA